MDKVIIIAEAGVNHNGSYELAKQMIIAAKEAGADYIKFQTAVPELVISKYAVQADYQKENTGVEESQLDMCRRIHLPLGDYQRLKWDCEREGIKFLSTSFDLVSIDVLEELRMDFMKIPSGEITNLPFLRKIAGLGIPVILSTGMSNLGEIEKAIGVLEGNGLGREKIILLHCNTEYPTPYEDVNLKAMQTLSRSFSTRVGYSDHTLGIEIPIAAVAMGASVIEKHFTLDRGMEGPDHKASLMPGELKAMVSAIRNVELALGDGRKEPTGSELANLAVARKSIVAACGIKKGEEFTTQNLTTKRPGDGISPMEWYRVLGKVAVRDFGEDERIEL